MLLFSGNGVNYNLDSKAAIKMNKIHIFNDANFWQHFQKQILSESWKCDFTADILLENLAQDAVLYKDDSLLRHRRRRIIPWMNNDSQWTAVILRSCIEIANKEYGPHSKILKELRIFNAFEDFVEHLDFFYTVASTMSHHEQCVLPLSQCSSQVHDIDKLDPVMLLGYSERFEDNATTSVWDSCVERHVRVNPHHQAHPFWMICSDDEATKESREDALREMVCDKVSRRLQKNLDGVVGKDMWNVDMVFFQGLPQNWLERASGIMNLMKKNNIVVKM